MNLNLEQKVKWGLLIMILLLIGGFAFWWWQYQIDILSAAIVIILAIVFLLIIEFYLRIQHNVDARFRRINIELVKNQLELSSQLEKLMNENQAAQEQIKQNQETIKQDQTEIKQNQETIKQDQTEIKQNQETIKQDQTEIKQGQETIKQDQTEIKQNQETIKQDQTEIKQGQEQEFNDIKQHWNEELHRVEKRNQKSFWLLNRINWFILRRERLNSLKQMASDIFDYKTVFYIGARPDRSDFLNYFYQAGYKITLLEIYPPNVDYFKKIPWINQVILGDLRRFETQEKYDVVFWWHGPEHISQDELKPILAKLEKMAKKIVVLGCPWGVTQNRRPEDNVYEKHLSSFESADFEKLGYGTDCLGDKDKSGSHITAIKYVDEKF